MVQRRFRKGDRVFYSIKGKNAKVVASDYDTSFGADYYIIRVDGDKKDTHNVRDSELSSER